MQLDELCSQLQLSREAAESSQLAAAALQAQLSNVDSKSKQSEAELRVKSATLETDNTALRVSFNPATFHYITPSSFFF